MPTRKHYFISEARAAATELWALLFRLGALQQEWNSLDYGGLAVPANALGDGQAENTGITQAQVQGVVLDICNELRTRITNTALSGNVAKLL